MPIDPSIALGVKPIQLANPLEQFGQFQQVQSAMNQNRLADLMYGQQQREADSQNALAKLISGGAKGDDIVRGLASQGYGKQAQAYAAQQRELAYKDAQTKDLTSKSAKSDYDLSEAKRQKAITDIAALTDPAQASAALDAHVQSGELPATMADALRQTIPQNPADFPKWQIGMLQRIMAPKDAAAFLAPDANAKLQSETSIKTTGMNNATSIKTTQMNNATSTANNESTNATTRRGQDMTNERMKEANANKPLTESQGKATTFAARMADADSVINKLESKGVTGADISPNLAANKFTNWLASSEGQQYRQAQENWVTANLRLESGAVIGVDEMGQEIKKYFPQPGDGKEVIKQKAAARAVAQRGMAVQAGPGAKNIKEIATGSLPQGWSVEAH